MVRCVCASMNPGSSVASPRSITSASVGMLALDPVPAILPSVTTTTPGVTSELLLPSNSLAAFSTYDLDAFFCCPIAGHTPRPHKAASTMNLRILCISASSETDPKNPNAQNSLSAGNVKAIPRSTANGDYGREWLTDFPEFLSANPKFLRVRHTKKCSAGNENFASIVAS